MNDDFQLLSHYDRTTWPEWGSAPRGPLIDCDMAHKGELLDTVIGPDPSTGKSRVYYVLRCELCILTHIFPLPDPDALAAYYTDQFYQMDHIDYVVRYEYDRMWWETCVHGPILEQCLEELGEAVPDPVRFLEIGAGPGIALDVAKQRFGWETNGMEPNHDLCLNLDRRGHDPIFGTLEDHMARRAIYPDVKADMWDILYLYEVLEHQPNPESFLLDCYELLNPGGLIVVVVPNDYAPYQLQAIKQLGLGSYWLAPPQHLNYFTPKTLQLVLRRAGFSLVDLRGTYPIDQHLLRGQNYIGNYTLGRQLHQQRMAEELAVVAAGDWLQREQQYRDQMRHRIGREIVAIGRKPVRS